ncbi:MAG: hypothetical protein AAF519_02005 [Bacteroidota bacterium]
MERRDILKDQIEQLGRVLGKMIAKLLKLKDEDAIATTISEVEQELQDELDLNIEALLKLKDQAIDSYLKDRKFHRSHFEALGEYLYHSGALLLKKDEVRAHHYFNTALALLDLTDKATRTLSLEREAKKAEIKGLMGR